MRKHASYMVLAIPNPVSGQLLTSIGLSEQCAVPCRTISGAAGACPDWRQARSRCVQCSRFTSSTKQRGMGHCLGCTWAAHISTGCSITASYRLSTQHPIDLKFRNSEFFAKFLFWVHQQWHVATGENQALLASSLALCQEVTPQAQLIILVRMGTRLPMGAKGADRAVRYLAAVSGSSVRIQAATAFSNSPPG